MHVVLEAPQGVIGAWCLCISSEAFWNFGSLGGVQALLRCDDMGAGAKAQITANKSRYMAWSKGLLSVHRRPLTGVDWFNEFLGSRCLLSRKREHRLERHDFCATLHADTSTTPRNERWTSSPTQGET